MLRRNDKEFGDFFDDYLKTGLIVGIVITVVVFLLGCIVVHMKRDQTKEANNFILAVENQPVDDPKSESVKTVKAIKKTLGVKILSEKQQDLIFSVALDFRNGFGLKENVFGEVTKQVEEYTERKKRAGGFGMKYSPASPMQWKSFFGMIRLFGLAVIYLSMFVNFILSSAESSILLLDLPWRRVWSWIFLALTLPVGFPFYLASLKNWIPAFRSYEADLRARREYEEIERLRRDPSRVRERIAKERGDLSARIEEVMAPEELIRTRENWQKIHGANRLRSWEAHMKVRRKRVDEVRSELIRLGDEVRSRQSDLAEARWNLRELEYSKPAAGAEETSPLTNAELNRLRSFPIVQAIQASPDEISVWTNPVIFRNMGRKFDLGTYLVKVEDIGNIPIITVRCIVSGRLDGEKTHLYGGGQGGNFCFGNRNDQIGDLLKKGEYLAALDLALQGIAYVNESGWHTLSDFLEVTDEKVA